MQQLSSFPKGHFTVLISGADFAKGYCTQVCPCMGMYECHWMKNGLGLFPGVCGFWITSQGLRGFNTQFLLNLHLQMHCCNSCLHLCGYRLLCTVWIAQFANKSFVKSFFKFRSLFYKGALSFIYCLVKAVVHRFHTVMKCILFSTWIRSLCTLVPLKCRRYRGRTWH